MRVAVAAGQRVRDGAGTETVRRRYSPREYFYAQPKKAQS
jgi:hypothetical protein